MNNENTNGRVKRFLTWAGFIVIVALIIWGLIAAQQKAAREKASLILPDQIVVTDHIRGSETAPVTLVEYGDFQCPACRDYHSMVEQVIAAEASSTLRFVFRHFPLSQHPNAIPAAQASEAANIQGKFWDMHNLLFDKQKDWEAISNPKDAFVAYAKQLGLDEKKFSEDYELQSVRDRINLDYKGGVAARINSTPTFFVNGKQISNPSSYDEFKKIIDDAIPKVSL